MTRTDIKCIAVLCLMLTQISAYAAGLLFNVTASGQTVNPAISITLCLNAQAKISCQNYSVSALSLSIRTVAPNHAYPGAGIRVNTPGYSLDGLGVQCTPLNNGYCAFTVSNTAPVTISIKNTALMLYGVTGESGPSQHTLFTLSTTTGYATQVMPLTQSVCCGHIIASDGNSLYHWNGHGIPGQIFEKINLSALTTSTIPLTGSAIDEPDGAVFFHSDNAFLYSDNNSNLSTVTIGGVASLIGTMPTSPVRGLACYNHLIYGGKSSAANLYQIDPSNGNFLSTTTITLAGFTVQGLNGLTVNPDTGVFYAVLKVLGSTPRKLVTINVNTGVATLIGNADNGSGLQFSSIAFQSADSSC